MCTRKIYDHELIYIIKGKGNFTIDSHCYDVKENDLVLIHPTVVHFVKTSYSEPYEFLGIHFDFFKQTDSENFIYSVVDGKIYTKDNLEPHLYLKRI